MTNDRPWYTVIVLGILAIASGAAAFWLTAYTDADAEQFMTVFIFLAGAIAGQAIPPAVSALANRQLDAAVERPAPIEYQHPDDRAMMEYRARQRAEADAQLAAQATPPAS